MSVPHSYYISMTQSYTPSHLAAYAIAKEIVARPGNHGLVTASVRCETLTASDDDALVAWAFKLAGANEIRARVEGEVENAIDIMSETIWAAR